MSALRARTSVQITGEPVEPQETDTYDGRRMRIVRVSLVVTFDEGGSYLRWSGNGPKLLRGGGDSLLDGTPSDEWEPTPATQRAFLEAAREQAGLVKTYLVGEHLAEVPQ